MFNFRTMDFTKASIAECGENASGNGLLGSYFGTVDYFGAGMAEPAFDIFDAALAGPMPRKPRAADTLPRGSVAHAIRGGS
jgi:hypothetical protein